MQFIIRDMSILCCLFSSAIYIYIYIYMNMVRERTREKEFFMMERTRGGSVSGNTVCLPKRSVSLFCFFLSSCSIWNDLRAVKDDVKYKIRTRPSNEWQTKRTFAIAWLFSSSITNGCRSRLQIMNRQMINHCKLSSTSITRTCQWCIRSVGVRSRRNRFSSDLNDIYS
jgi:hypothetical protein